MPANRTSGLRPSRPNSRKLPERKSQDIIDLCSSGDETPVVPPPPKKRKGKNTTVARENTVVIEILDEDRASKRLKVGSSSSSSGVESARLKKLEEENKQLRDALLRAQSQSAPALDSAVVNVELVQSYQRLERSLATLRESKKKLLDDLDQACACEVCTIKMWQPYTLTCGHIFCEQCLSDWFSQTLALHMHAHPEFLANPSDFLRGLPRHNALQMQAYLDRVYMLWSRQALPQYTCPTCRARVTSKPIPQFALKNMVQIIAEAQGERDPSRLRDPRNSNNGPWEGFFPTPARR